MPTTTPNPVGGKCRLEGDVLLIAKVERKGKITHTDYHVEKLTTDPLVATTAIRLTKRLADGTPSENPDHQYEVWINEHGMNCTCLDFLNRRENAARKCKHCMALVAVGLLPKVEVPHVD